MHPCDLKPPTALPTNKFEKEFWKATHKTYSRKWSPWATSSKLHVETQKWAFHARLTQKEVENEHFASGSLENWVDKLNTSLQAICLRIAWKLRVNKLKTSILWEDSRKLKIENSFQLNPSLLAYPWSNYGSISCQQQRSFSHRLLPLGGPWKQTSHSRLAMVQTHWQWLCFTTAIHHGP